MEQATSSTRTTAPSSISSVFRTPPGSLEELGEATLSILCHGNPLPMRVIEAKLIVGERLGEVPVEAPTVPLQRDLAALQKSLRLKISADDTLLDLDQRKEMDLARSRLLHRLTILKIDWGQLQEDQRQRCRDFRAAAETEAAVNGGDVGVDGQAQPVHVERLLLVDELIGGRFERSVAQAPAVQRRESPVLQCQAD